MPITLVAFWQVRVDGAPVPEASIDEDRQPSGRKSYVNLLFSIMNSISIALVPQGPPKEDLWFCILRTYS